MSNEEETTPREGRRWPWQDRAEGVDRDGRRELGGPSREERAERLRHREEDAAHMRAEVGAIAKSPPDPYCVPMNLPPEHPECQPRPKLAPQRGGHSYGRHR